MVIKISIAVKPGINHCLNLETVDRENRDSDRQTGRQADRWTTRWIAVIPHSQRQKQCGRVDGRTDGGTDRWIPLVLKKLFSSVLSSWYSVLMVPVFSPRNPFDCPNIQMRVIDHSSDAL